MECSPTSWRRPCVCRRRPRRRSDGRPSTAARRAAPPPASPGTLRGTPAAARAGANGEEGAAPRHRCPKRATLDSSAGILHRDGARRGAPREKMTPCRLNLQESWMNHPDDPNLDPKGGVSVPRRTFLAGAAATAGFTIVPRHVLGGQGTTAPSEKLNIAGSASAGWGRATSPSARPRTSSPCATWTSSWRPRRSRSIRSAKQYKDFRVMLDKQKDIDAVIVATPDHTPRRGRHGGHAARQARLRAEAADPHASTRPAC